MKDFIQLVADMRAAQREYFQTRTRTSLTKAKDLEGKVDKYIAQAPQQQKLPL
jgi:hypothetical protein